MIERVLSIEIAKGTWMLDVVAERNDNGIYDLVYPKKEANVNRGRVSRPLRRGRKA